jgi:20S proteasome alpha/beta subunit
MTRIIGARCIDGVVLIGDRKIVNHDNSFDFRDKLFMVYYPIVVGLAGETLPFEDVKREALEMAQRSLTIQSSKTEPEILPLDFKNISGIARVYPTSDTSTPRLEIYQYLDKLGGVIKRHVKEYPFEALVSAQTEDRGSLLFHFDIYGNHSDQHEFIVTGDGRTQAIVLLKPLWNKKMSMNEFTQLAYFIIKYIDRFSLNNTVGLGGLKPQVYFVPDKGNVEEASPSNIIHQS